MDEQGGAGGVPLEGGRKPDRHRTARAGRREDGARADRPDDGTTSAADTDEASRLDRPQQPEKPGGKTSRKGTRWVGPRDA
ncbi:hypothetical protein OHA37_36420 [Streptomyces sp. NBC_00335]|uniref:hypothetical protein n=1 Tax=unclassified Streptomyces TaxID=2593676 RepID=UPI002252C031|nr:MULTISPECIES: hypothetical protein [unclassified Streptomyces]MCX5409328.1 hypothetical protein [Streptomyces sp. NBC_00086]